MLPPTRLPTSTLLRHLRAAHGAAIIDLQTHGADGRQRAIERALLHHGVGYDQQVEGYMPDYAIRACGLADPSGKMLKRILTAVPRLALIDGQPKPGEWNSWRLWLCAACELSRRGDARALATAKRILFAWPENSASGYYLEQTDLDGFLDWYGRVERHARRHGREQWADFGEVDALADRVGNKRLLAELTARASKDARAKSLRAVAASRLEPQSSAEPAPSRRFQSATSFKEWVATGCSPDPVFESRMTPTDLRALVTLFAGIAQHRAALGRLAPIARALKRLPLSVPPAALLRLLVHRRWRVRRTAAEALSGTRHARVRATALRLIRTAPPSNVASGALLLLIATFRSGDEKWVVHAFRRLERSREDSHSATLAALKVIEANPAANWGEALEWAWNSTPCSHCREDILKRLLRRGDATPDIIEQARLDGNHDVRALVNKP